MGQIQRLSWGGRQRKSGGEDAASPPIHVRMERCRYEALTGRKSFICKVFWELATNTPKIHTVCFLLESMYSNTHVKCIGSCTILPLKGGKEPADTRITQQCKKGDTSDPQAERPQSVSQDKPKAGLLTFHLLDHQRRFRDDEQKLWTNKEVARSCIQGHIISYSAR